MTFDLYAWKSPRDLDADGIEALLEEWHAAGGDPATSPFEPSTDVGWFYLELTKDEPSSGHRRMPCQARARRRSGWGRRPTRRRRASSGSR